jgi:hypothetical protein
VHLLPNSALASGNLLFLAMPLRETANCHSEKQQIALASPDVLFSGFCAEFRQRSFLSLFS